MIILDNLKLGTLIIANLATGGPIGTASATVDIASSFAVNQTTAGQAITLPVPTNAIAGDQIRVVGVGTASFTVLGKTVAPGTFTDVFWTGSSYAVDADSGRNQGATITVAALTAGNNTITHNLSMPVGSFSSINMDVRDANGSNINLRRVIASDTTNAIVVSTPVAIATPVTFYLSPLA